MTRAEMGITQQRLKDVLHYDPDTGRFTWKYREERHPRWNGRYAGKEAGGLSHNGYRYITIDFIDFRANRLAWLYQTGAEPNFIIDHIDGNRTNDAWWNLRPATNSQNNANHPKQKNNTSGFKGVHWATRERRWIAKINKHGKSLSLGTFKNPEDGARAYDAAAVRLFGEFASTNFPVDRSSDKEAA